MRERKTNNIKMKQLLMNAPTTRRKFRQLKKAEACGRRDGRVVKASGSHEGFLAARQG
jgi:hypothetical protein